MKYIYVGDIVNTHGIKGELRISSDFKYKDKIYKEDFKFYVGRKKELLTLETHRKNKEFDLIKFFEVEDINDALGYKGDQLFINRDDINVDGYFDEDIIGLNVYGDDKLIGNIETIMKGCQDILVIKNKDKKYLVPYVDEFVKNIDLTNNRMDINLIEGLIDED